MITLRKLCKDEVHVADVRRSPLIPHHLQHLPPGPSPGCSDLVTPTEQMFNILDLVLSSACWVWAEIILNPVLLIESSSVAINAVSEGEKQIFLLDLQNFVSESWKYKFFEIDFGEFQCHFRGTSRSFILEV